MLISPTRIFTFFSLLFLLNPRSEAQMSPVLEARLDAMFQHAEQSEGFSGVALVGRGESPLYLKAFGYADRSKDVRLKPDDQFMIASVSKGFTAAAILKLAEKGKLNLADSIARFLPEYQRPVANKVQIHHLLTHTSGIPDFINDHTYSFFLKRWLGWRPEMGELIETIQKMETFFDAGEDFSYSNSGYVLLARIVEKVSGQNFNTFLQKEILEPLDMTNTGAGDFELAARPVFGYKAKKHKKKPLKNLEPEFTVGMGGLYSTAEDLLKWTHGITEPGLLADSSLHKMFSPFMQEYGYGWEIDESWGRPRITHSGYFPGWTTYVLFFPEEKLSFIILSNVDNDAPDKAIREMVQTWYANRGTQSGVFSRIKRRRYEGDRSKSLYTLQKRGEEMVCVDEAGKVYPLEEDVLQKLSENKEYELKIAGETLSPVDL